MESILVVDDHQIVFSGIKLICETSNKNYLFDHCINGDQCIIYLKKQSVDLIILDVNLPDTDTFALLGLILSINPTQNILIFSMSSEALYAKRFLKLGAKGFISKQVSNEEFLKALDLVINGNRYLSPFLSNLLTDEALFGTSENPFDVLTEREFEIMTYFLQGNGSKEVANITNLHSSTIGTYKFRILEKLNVSNLIDLMELAKFHGVLV